MEPQVQYAQTKGGLMLSLLSLTDEEPSDSRIRAMDE
jgi:hypothetical protein